MHLPRRDLRTALLIVLVAIAVLAAGRLLSGPQDDVEACERAVGSARGGSDQDVERVCSRLP